MLSAECLDDIQRPLSLVVRIRRGADGDSKGLQRAQLIVLMQADHPERFFRVKQADISRFKISTMDNSRGTVPVTRDAVFGVMGGLASRWNNWKGV